MKACSLRTASLRTAFLLLATWLTACASVPMDTEARDAQGKRFATVPGKANLYVYRDQFFGASAKLPVLLNGILIGETGPRTYLALEVEPGTHRLVSQGENDSTLDVKVEADNNYFVHQEIQLGFGSARSQLALVDTTTGRVGVNASKRIAPITSIVPKPMIPAVVIVEPAKDASGKPLPPPPPSLGRGEFEHHAEEVAKSAGCKTDSGERPPATLVERAPGLQVYEVGCRAAKLTVRCEAGLCRAVR